MDEYDPRRLPAYRNKDLKMSAVELKSLALVEPLLSEEELSQYLDSPKPPEESRTSKLPKR